MLLLLEGLMLRRNVHSDRADHVLQLSVRLDGVVLARYPAAVLSFMHDSTQ